MPWVLWPWSLQAGVSMPLVSTAILATLMPRILATIRFQQSRLAALLHPLGIIMLLLIQWWALFRDLVHWPRAWKGRNYTSLPCSVGATNNSS